jgi:hypothetical protein
MRMIPISGKILYVFQRKIHGNITDWIIKKNREFLSIESNYRSDYLNQCVFIAKNKGHLSEHSADITFEQVPTEVEYGSNLGPVRKYSLSNGDGYNAILCPIEHY